MSESARDQRPIQHLLKDVIGCLFISLGKAYDFHWIHFRVTPTFDTSTHKFVGTDEDKRGGSHVVVSGIDALRIGMNRFGW